MEVTLGQAFQTLKIFQEQELTREELQAVFDSGLFVDVIDAIKSGKPIDRKAVRKALGLSPELRVLMNIKLGTEFQSPDDFRRAFKESDGRFRISDWADSMLGQPAFAQSLADADPEHELELVVLITAQLTGKENGGTTAEVFAGADKLGFEKCPLWVGPKSRLDYENQTEGEWLLIGIEPIIASDGGLSVFGVGCRADDRWLHSYFGLPVFFWGGGRRWVFGRPASGS